MSDRVERAAAAGARQGDIVMRHGVPYPAGSAEAAAWREAYVAAAGQTHQDLVAAAGEPAPAEPEAEAVAETEEG